MSFHTKQFHCAIIKDWIIKILNMTQINLIKYAYKYINQCNYTLALQCPNERAVHYFMQPQSFDFFSAVLPVWDICSSVTEITLLLSLPCWSVASRLVMFAIGLMRYRSLEFSHWNQGFIYWLEPASCGHLVQLWMLGLVKPDNNKIFQKRSK